MNIADRIQMVMRMHNLNASSFAESIGVQRSGISHILSGRNKPSLDLIQKILVKYPRVDAEWLVTGKNPDSNRETEVPQEEQGPDQEKKRDESKDDSSVEKIMMFFADGTFREYRPQE